MGACIAGISERRFLMYFVYLLKCRDGSVYTGITTDVARRLQEHRAGTASRYTRAKGAVKVLHIERYKTRSAALKREAAIKRLPRSKKIALTPAGSGGSR